MVSVQISLKKHKKALMILAAAALIVVACVAVRLHSLPPKTGKSGGQRVTLQIQNGDYRAFLAQFGLDSNGKPTAEKAVRIPEEFDETYSAYNELQRQAGFDLTPYRGQEAVQLTFSVRNRTETPRAVLLVLRGCVIGGHLTDGIYGSEPSALVI